jgi:hypothetical protein
MSPNRAVVFGAYHKWTMRTLHWLLGHAGEAKVQDNTVISGYTVKTNIVGNVGIVGILW